MSFPGSARVALRNEPCLRWTIAAFVLVFAGLAISCGSSSSSKSATHNAYITLPAGSVQLLHLNNSTGAITLGAQTPPVAGTTPTGLALHPSKKFLFAANSAANTISVFNVASNGTLTLSTLTPAGVGPRGMVLDPSGQYLLVTNTVSNSISVFSVDAGSGALTEVAGSPFPSNNGPTEILITPSGKFVYVTNPSIGFITAYTFAGGVLSQVTGSPYASGAGVGALAVESGEQFLYTANTIANTISGFAINSTSGALTAVPGSPFSSAAGTGPSAMSMDTVNKFLYVATQGSSFSIWAFTWDSATGTLTPASNSPFNLLSAGGLFLVMEPDGGFFYVGNSQSGANNIAAFQYSSGNAAPTTVTGSPFSIGSAPGKMVISH
ncbi:MAG: lactonase family protein [Acidobacteriia bacterium]|nr:lactonase family protein [Terriglobia bacterium]